MAAASELSRTLANDGTSSSSSWFTLTSAARLCATKFCAPKLPSCSSIAAPSPRHDGCGSLKTCGKVSDLLLIGIVPTPLRINTLLLRARSITLAATGVGTRNSASGAARGAHGALFAFGVVPAPRDHAGDEAADREVGAIHAGGRPNVVGTALFGAEAERGEVVFGAAAFDRSSRRVAVEGVALAGAGFLLAEGVEFGGQRVPLLELFAGEVFVALFCGVIEAAQLRFDGGNARDNVSKSHETLQRRDRASHDGQRIRFLPELMEIAKN